MQKPIGLDHVLKAISYAARRHEGQRRKDGKTPYAAHPMRVMTVLTTVFGVKEPEVLCAALLHDTIEDTTADYDDLAKEFSPRVAGWVGELSKDKRLPEEIREKAYFAGLARASIEVKLCKMGDTYDNLKDSATLEAKGRFKAVAKARELVEKFEKGWPAEWTAVMEKVKVVIEEAEKRTES